MDDEHHDEDQDNNQQNNITSILSLNPFMRAGDTVNKDIENYIKFNVNNKSVSTFKKENIIVFILKKENEFYNPSYIRKYAEKIISLYIICHGDIDYIVKTINIEITFFLFDLDVYKENYKAFIVTDNYNKNPIYLKKNMETDCHHHDDPARNISFEYVFKERTPTTIETIQKNITNNFDFFFQGNVVRTGTGTDGTKHYSLEEVKGYYSFNLSFKVNSKWILLHHNIVFPIYLYSINKDNNQSNLEFLQIMNNLINELKKQISFYLSNTDTTITFANNYSINIKKDGLLGILEELFYKFVDADTEADNNKLQENADLYNFYFKKKLELLEYPQPIQSTNLYLFMNKTIMDYYLLISPIFRYNKRLVIIKELYKCDPCLLRNYHLNTAGMRTASQKEETLIIF